MKCNTFNQVCHSYTVWLLVYEPSQNDGKTKEISDRYQSQIEISAKNWL